MTKKHDLLLYYFPECPYCRKVLNYLETAGISVPLKNVNENAEFRKELQQKGGKTQVPCLFIDDKPLYESDDIIMWLKKHLQ